MYNVANFAFSGAQIEQGKKWTRTDTSESVQTDKYRTSTCE